MMTAKTIGTMAVVFIASVVMSVGAAFTKLALFALATLFHIPN